MKSPILKHFDCNKFISDNCHKARTFNALFTSAFTKKHTIPEFPTSSEDTIYSIPFTFDKVNSKLKILQFHELKSQGHF